MLKSNRGSASQLADILSSESKPISGCVPDPSDPTKDSDHDGLTDWQEINIYHTDPCNPDTNGDGYLDGESVASGYDPAAKDSNTRLPGANPVSPRPLPQNLTDALSQELKDQISQGQIPQLDANGSLLSASSTDFESFPGVQAVVDEMAKSNTDYFAPDAIDDSQIKTTPDNSREAILNYAAEASAAFSHSAPKSQTETEMFSNAIENSDFSELDSNLQNYKNAYGRLKELTVPIDLVAIHKEQLDIISQLIKIYTAIKDINNDPLKADMALQSYKTVEDQLNSWLKDLSTFIQAHP